MNAIKGFDVLFKGDLPRGWVILVTGIEGVLKSGFVFDMMSNYLAVKNILKSAESGNQTILNYADIELKRLVAA